MFREVTRIPFMFAGPGVVPDTSYHTPVEVRERSVYVCMYVFLCACVCESVCDGFVWCPTYPIAHQ
jgi:hypothetical protein